LTGKIRLRNDILCVDGDLGQIKKNLTDWLIGSRTSRYCQSVNQNAFI